MTGLFPDLPGGSLPPGLRQAAAAARDSLAAPPPEALRIPGQASLFTRPVDEALALASLVLSGGTQECGPQEALLILHDSVLFERQGWS